MIWKLKYMQFEAKMTHRCRWTNPSVITWNSTLLRIFLNRCLCLASSLYIFQALAAVLSRAGALVDVRKHFYMMKAKAELLNQRHHPRNRIHNIVTRQCRIFSHNPVRYERGRDFSNERLSIANTHSSFCSSFLSASPPTNTRTLHLAQRFLRVSR